MGIPILVRRHLFIETVPCWFLDKSNQQVGHILTAENCHDVKFIVNGSTAGCGASISDGDVGIISSRILQASDVCKP